MAIQFRKATKEQSRLRLSIAGPAGAGKTFTALKLATEMAAILGGKIAVIDTEKGSASKYADQFEFDVIELDDFHPERYMEAMQAAEKAGYKFLIIDSTTHEWNGKNGILELHEAAIRRQKSKNSFTAWADVTPLHTAFIQAILGSDCHIIATVRSKTEYVQDNNNGRTEVRKVGMGSVQREGMDYEYDVQLEMDVDHVGVITKTRCFKLDGWTKKKPGAELAEILAEWLTSGVAPAPVKTPEPQTRNGANQQAAPTANKETLAAILELWPEYGEKLDGETVPFAEYIQAKRGTDPAQMAQADASKMLVWLQGQANKAKAAAESAAKETVTV